MSSFPSEMPWMQTKCPGMHTTSGPFASAFFTAASRSLPSDSFAAPWGILSAFSAASLSFA